MNKQKNKKIKKIHNQILNLALKGKSYYIEYSKAIDKYINDGEYSFFLQVLETYYNIKTSEYKNVNDLKKDTWVKILFETENLFQHKLKILYNNKKIYQIGYNIYSYDLNYLQLTSHGPLNQSYLPLTTTYYINFSKNENDIYFNTSESKVFKIETYKTDNWIETNNGSYEPVSKKIIEETYITQSNTKLQIPTTHGGDYLITVHLRPPLEIINYKLTLFFNNYLGQIIEEDIHTYNPNILFKNIELIKKFKDIKTNLKVIKNNNEVFYLEDEQENLSYYENLLLKYEQAINILLS